MSHASMTRFRRPDLGELLHATVAGGTFEVRSFGSGPPMVLIPGLAGGGRLLAPLVRRLSERWTVLVCPLRGEQPDATSARETPVRAHADDIADVISSLGLDRPTVAGVSYGGAVALELAINHPESVDSLIVTGIEARFEHCRFARVVRRVLDGCAIPHDSPFINQFFNVLHGDKISAQGPLGEFVIASCWQTGHDVISDRLASLELFDVSDRLSAIDCPSLVVAGARDSIVPAARQRALAEAIPEALYEEIEGAGHVGFLSHVDGFVQATRWLGRERLSVFG